MPRQIVNVGGSNPGTNPDKNLLDLINANASRSSARASARSAGASERTISLKERQEQKKLDDEALKVQDIPALLEALNKTPDKDFIESGQGDNLVSQLRGIVTPSTKVVSPNRNEDPEVTNRKQAISTTIPEAIPNEFAGTELSDENLGLDVPLTPEQVKEVDDYFNSLFIEDDVTFNGNKAQANAANLRSRPNTTGSDDPVLSTQNALTAEDVSFKEQHPDYAIPAEDIELNPGEVKDKKTGGIYPKGLTLPPERKTAILKALIGMDPKVVNQLMEDKVFGPVVKAALTDKPLAQLTIEKLIETATKSNAHGTIVSNDIGQNFMVDLSGPNPKQVLLSGSTGSTIAAIAKSVTGQKFMDFLLTKFTPDQLSANVDGKGNKISNQSLGKMFAKWQLDKDPNRTKLAIDMSKTFHSSKQLNNFNKIFTATRNIFGTDLTSFTSAKSVTDQVLVTMFNKLTDPDSVVREGEFQRIFEMRGMIGTWENWKTKIRDIMRTGGKAIPGVLSDDERNTIKEFALVATINELTSPGLNGLIESLDTGALEAKVNKNIAVPPTIRKQIKNAFKLQKRLAVAREDARDRQIATGKQQIIPGYTDIMRKR